MAITLKRQLTGDEKEIILARHGRRCFATGHLIPDSDAVHFDHIQAFALGGPSELLSIAPMCETHNKQKGTLPLADFRVKLRLEQFFSRGDALTLKDLLAFLAEEGDINEYGKRVAVREDKTTICLESADISETYALYTCPTTGWKYFYATLPVTIIDSDDDEDQKVGLQPRYLIPDKVFELYRHFQRHPVLQPSIGRIHQERVLLFDGQHKIVALLWNERRDFECKVYLSPDLRLLNQTNISAHDRFAQTRFYASIMVQKLGSEFGADFDRYKNLEDGTEKSEEGFMRFLERDPAQIGTKAERYKQFRSYLYNAAIQDEGNRAAKFISNGNRSTDEKPLTIDMVSKSLFACFLYTEPVADNMATDAYKRDKEIEYNVELMNMFYDLALGAWKPSAGTNDDTQRRLARLFRSKSIMAWSEILRDAVLAKLELHDAEDRARPFYRDVAPSDIDRIKKIVQRLVDWPLWAAPPNYDIDRILSDNKSAVKEWLKRNGLTTGYLLGAQE